MIKTKFRNKMIRDIKTYIRNYYFVNFDNLFIDKILKKYYSYLKYDRHDPDFCFPEDMDMDDFMNCICDYLKIDLVWPYTNNDLVCGKKEYYKRFNKQFNDVIKNKSNVLCYNKTFKKNCVNKIKNITDIHFLLF
jgi:hypothetical protein